MVSLQGENGNIAGQEPVLEPQLVKFNCYREYLQQIYLYKKSRRKGFSFRRFAAMAEIKSPNYLQLVIQGKRNLSVELAEKLANVLKFKAAEKKFFIGLVRRSQASTESEREALTLEIAKARRSCAVHLLQKGHKDLIREWFHLVVLELAQLPGFVADPVWICEKLSGMITQAQAESSLSLLFRMGFLVQNQDGSIGVKFQAITTGDKGYDRELVTKAHAGAMAKWAQILPELDEDSRELGLINIPISVENFAALKLRLREFQKEIIQWLGEEKEPTMVVQLGVSLIKATK